MTAALLTAIGQPLELIDLSIPSIEPDYGKVQVRIIAAGICGAQLMEIDGTKGNPKHIPHPMGHEGVGIVEKVGIGVTHCKEGDKVVLHWRCGAGIESDFPRFGWSGSGAFIYGGKVTTFMEQTVVSENRCTVVPNDAPDELCVLLGCSLSTALGTMEHEAKLKMGESVLIIGCGGLGLNLILAAKMMGACGIGVIDKEPEKLASSFALGATEVWFTCEGLEPLWNPFQVVIDTTGNPEMIAMGARFLAPSARMILVGQPKPGEYVKIENANHLFQGEGKTIMATQGGRFNPARDVPRYVAAWRSGHLKVDGIVTHKFALSDINEAIALVRAGQAGRVMILP